MNRLVLGCSFFLLFLFFSVFCVAQNRERQVTIYNTVYTEGEELCKKSMNFCRVLSFFKEEQYDSCYVSSGKLLLRAQSTSEKDFLNFTRGFSAFKKKIFKESLTNFLSISDHNTFNGAKLFLLGNTYLALDKYKEALECFFMFESEYLDNQDRKTGRNLYTNIATCYIVQKKYAKAQLYFDKGFEFLNKKDTLEVIRSKIGLARIYYNQYIDSKAIPLFKQAYDLAKSYNNIDLKRITSQNMAVVKKNRKQYKESIKYYEEYSYWKDSIWNRDKIWELTEKDKQLVVAQKQQEIVLQDEQIKRQKVVQKGLLLGTSGLLVFIGGLGFFYRKLKKQKQLITDQKEELDVANKTKNYLFSVVSHDLRSPINTIKRQHKKLAKHIANNDLSAIKEANQQAISVTDSTSHLLNNVLQWSLEQSNQLNFSQEDYALQPIIEHILFDYEDVAESNSISISTNFEEGIVVNTDKESLKIVLRNLIDNAIKYMNGAGNITITTTIQNNQARIELKDSGVGISEEKLQKINALKDLSVDKIDRSKGVGLGLILCQTLIKKNNGTLFFESVEGKSTMVIVLLPLA